MSLPFRLSSKGCSGEYKKKAVETSVPPKKKIQKFGSMASALYGPIQANSKTLTFFYGKSQDGFTRGKKNGLVHRDRILKQMYKYHLPCIRGGQVCYSSSRPETGIGDTGRENRGYDRQPEQKIQAGFENQSIAAGFAFYTDVANFMLNVCSV
jgi:hypothetical protein